MGQFNLTPEKKRRIEESRRKADEATEDYDPKAKAEPNRAVPVKGFGTLKKFDMEDMANEPMRKRIAAVPRLIASGLGADMTTANRLGEDVGSVADFIPGVGDALGVAETTEAAKQGDWKNTGINAIATAAGVVPGVGDLAAKGVKKLGKAAVEKAGQFTLKKEGKEAAEAAIRPSVDGTVGDLNNPSVMFEGVSPHDFTDTEQWHRFGQEYGVPNLGSPNKADWEASLTPFKTNAGVDFTVPGGVGNKDPFTYYDLLHLKMQGINPNDIPPELHQGIHDRMLTTMSPEGEVSPERLMNQLSLAQISPNQPLTPNELAVARVMAKGPEDIERLGSMVPWRHSDDPATSGAKDIVASRPALDEKTGERLLDKKGNPKNINTTRRQQTSSDIANQLGLGAGERGGLGARGTADYTRIAETAQRVKEDPDFFRFRGAGEGGGAEAHDPENWSNFVERLSNQTPGLSSKTGSFGAVWQNPAKANISAVDRHMAGKFTADMFPSTADYDAFRSQAVQRYAKANPGKAVNDFDALPQSFKNDQLFGYLNANPGMTYRGKPAKGSNSGQGAVNERVPAHLQPDEARWVHEPSKIELISDPYRRVLDANAEEANKAGQSIFGSQWMLWDRIRNRMEPHEIMFPGLEKLPRMSMEQMHRARKDLSEAGYMSGTKTVDELTGEPTGLQPVRRLPSASRASYFSIAPGGVVGGAGMAEALRERERDGKKKKREEG